MTKTHGIWAEKYRPQTIDDLIVPKAIHDTLQNITLEKASPHLMFTGTPGTGKTTAAVALVNDLKGDYIIINGSLKRNIGDLSDIEDFVTTRSLTGRRKYVIIDEGDYLNPNSFQPAFRNFMERYSKNVTFIITCNFKDKILPAIHSRMSVIDFKVPKDEVASILMRFFKRIETILETEGVKYKKPVLIELVKNYFPDYRNTLNELQRFALQADSDGIGEWALASTTFDNIDGLIKAIQAKDYTECRKWIGLNSSVDLTSIYSVLYKKIIPLLVPSSVPEVVIIINEYQYKSAFVNDQEINISACLAEIMVAGNWS